MNCVYLTENVVEEVWDALRYIPNKLELVLMNLPELHEAHCGTEHIFNHYMLLCW